MSNFQHKATLNLTSVFILKSVVQYDGWFGLIGVLYECVLSNRIPQHYC